MPTLERTLVLLAKLKPKPKPTKAPTPKSSGLKHFVQDINSIFGPIVHLFHSVWVTLGPAWGVTLIFLLLAMGSTKKKGMWITFFVIFLFVAMGFSVSVASSHLGR